MSRIIHKSSGSYNRIRMPDPVELEIFRELFHSIAEEMGASLRRSAFSPNIRERRDYSCAVFDRSAQVIAMGDHMPVHLGSMPMSVRAAIERLDLGPGDVAMVNDPFAGGTQDRKSTRLNSSHRTISYAVFCLNKK